MKTTSPQRRRRVRHKYNEENVDRWMVSYADFITLLFAMFVVLYAISSVNEGKYKILSSALSSNFGAVLEEGIESAADEETANEFALQLLSEAVASDLPDPVEEQQVVADTVVDEPQTGHDGDIPPLPDETPEAQYDGILESVADELTSLLSNLIKDGNVSLRRTIRGLELEINSRLLFESASSELNAEYQPLLADIAEVLNGRYNAVDVEGFTDNVPISTDRYPSNWELSAARAAAVIRLLVETGISPDRLSAVGYGPYRPVAVNNTEEGRAKNRRVVMVIKDSERILPLAPAL